MRELYFFLSPHASYLKVSPVDIVQGLEEFVGVGDFILPQLHNQTSIGEKKDKCLSVLGKRYKYVVFASVVQIFWTVYLCYSISITFVKFILFYFFKGTLAWFGVTKPSFFDVGLMETGADLCVGRAAPFGRWLCQIQKKKKKWIHSLTLFWNQKLRLPFPAVSILCVCISVHKKPSASLFLNLIV